MLAGVYLWIACSDYHRELEQALKHTCAGDHHDTFSHTLEQLAAIKGKSNFSKPFGWAYMDMMMTGGQGCNGHDGKSPNPDKPTHCPGQNEGE
jgi:alpha-galactosidase